MNIRPLLMPAFLLTVSGGLAGWLLLAEPPGPSQEQAARTGDAGGVPAAGTSPSPSVDTGQTVAQQTVTAPLPDDIRDVSPEGVSAPRVDGSLKRIEPSKRYLELKDPPVEPIPDGPIELVRVQVLDGGHIKSDRLTVTLAHIKPLKLDETCLSRLGGSWPCGARARTFLRGLVRQFKVTCEKIEETGPQQILATCSRGKFDLSKRLVRYGWADPGDDAGTELIELAEQARKKDRQVAVRVAERPAENLLGRRSCRHPARSGRTGTGNRRMELENGRPVRGSTGFRGHTSLSGSMNRNTKRRPLAASTLKFPNAL